MADGGSDDEVIHLASFNVHRSQGETFMHLSICLLPLVQVRAKERARAFRICGKVDPGMVTSLLQS